MSRRRKRKSYRLPTLRFPRLNLKKEDSIAEGILHATYNALAIDRIHYEGYDLYRTRIGISAPVKFAMLGQMLVEKKIDPAIYLKVLCRYGRFAETKYLPSPTLLCGEKAFEAFHWLAKKERDKYEFKSDWKKSLRAGKDEDIYDSLRKSSLMVRDVRKNFNLRIAESVLFLKSEISPWYWAWFIASVKKKRANELLNWLIAEEPELRNKIILSTKFYVEHTHVWRKARQIIGRYL